MIYDFNYFTDVGIKHKYIVIFQSLIPVFLLQQTEILTVFG